METVVLTVMACSFSSTVITLVRPREAVVASDSGVAKAFCQDRAVEKRCRLDTGWEGFIGVPVVFLGAPPSTSSFTLVAEPRLL